MKINLIKSIFDKIVELGGSESKDAQEFFGKSANVLSKWSSGTAIPDVLSAQRILDDILEKMPEGDVIKDTTGQPFGNPKQGKTRPDPAPKHSASKAETTEGEKADRDTPIDKEPPKPIKEKPIPKINMLCPTNRDYNFLVVLSLLGNFKASMPEAIRSQLPSLDIEHDTMIHRSRNILATRFMNTQSEWSFWMDSDIVAPIGNPSWFDRRTGGKIPPNMNYAAMDRLTNRGKTLIGAAYVERNKGGKLIAQPGLSPATKQDKAIATELKKGIQDKIMEIGWIGFGCVAVHRSVFQDILDKVPGVKSEDGSKPHGFFTSFETGPQGEDVAFCKRALQAGHKTFLDLSIHCGHIGKHVFMP